MTSLFLPVICFGLRRGEDDGQSLGCDEESLGKNFAQKLEKRYFLAAL